MTTEPENSGLRGRTIRRWIGAATLITALHVCGGTWAMRNWQAQESIEEPAGAMVVEIAEVQTTAAVATLEHGQVQNESRAKPASIQQEQQDAAGEKREEPLSKIPDPEVAIEKKPPSEREEEKPTEEVAKTDSQAQAPSPESRAKAPTEIEGAVAEKSAAPRSGASTTSNAAVSTWKSAMVMHINGHKRYPEAARPRQLAGDVQIVFSIDRSGRVLQSRVQRSSGSSLLDEEAMQLFKRASPLPLPPPAVQGEILEYSLPIHFRM
ncbi:MAG: energy transducer TonB [Hyphomicrobiaceae bacterium]